MLKVAFGTDYTSFLGRIRKVKLAAKPSNMDKLDNTIFIGSSENDPWIIVKLNIQTWNTCSIRAFWDMRWPITHWPRAPLAIDSIASWWNGFTWNFQTLKYTTDKWSEWLINRSTNQQTNQSINQPINKSISSPSNKSTNQWINESIDRSISQPFNQSISYPFNQSINQSINQPFSRLCYRTYGCTAYTFITTPGTCRLHYGPLRCMNQVENPDAVINYRFSG